jgi:hypothetical protein
MLSRCGPGQRISLGDPCHWIRAHTCAPGVTRHELPPARHQARAELGTCRCRCPASGRDGAARARLPRPRAPRRVRAGRRARRRVCDRRSGRGRGSRATVEPGASSVPPGGWVGPRGLLVRRAWPAARRGSACARRLCLPRGGRTCRRAWRPAHAADLSAPGHAHPQSTERRVRPDLRRVDCRARPHRRARAQRRRVRAARAGRRAHDRGGGRNAGAARGVESRRR